MANTKEQKREIVAQYGEWLERSEAFVVTEYTGLTMKDMDVLRRMIREAGGEFHVVKNTLVKLALKEAAVRRGTTLGEVVRESLVFYGIKTQEEVSELVARARRKSGLEAAEAKALANRETRAERTVS